MPFPHREDLLHPGIEPVDLCLLLCRRILIKASIKLDGLPWLLRGEESTCNAGDTGPRVQSLGGEDPLEKEMTTHSSVLAWKIPWTEEPGGYSPWGHKQFDITYQLNNNTTILDESSILLYCPPLLLCCPPPIK